MLHPGNINCVLSGFALISGSFENSGEHPEQEIAQYIVLSSRKLHN